MARCNCSSPTSCGCGFASSDSVAVANAGTPSDPWVADVNLATTAPGLEILAGAGGGLRAFVDGAGGLLRGGNGLALDPAQFAPRGAIGYSTRTTDQAGFNSTATDLTGCSVSFTAVAGRRYRVSSFVRCLQGGANGQCEVYLANAANTVFGSTDESHINGEYRTHRSEAIIVPGSGLYIAKIRVYVSAGTVTVASSAAVPSWILVEDIGL
jgi:hypothetical protein